MKAVRLFSSASLLESRSTGDVTTRPPVFGRCLMVSVRMRNQVEASNNSTLNPCAQTMMEPMRVPQRKSSNTHC